MHRAGALLLSTICLTSCADVLGLDGLSYDQGQTKAEARRGGTAGDGDFPLGTGGELELVLGGSEGLRTSYKDTDFPVLWPEDSLIVTLPAALDSNFYWVYRPSEHLLYSYELNFTGADLLGRQAWPKDIPVSHLVAVPSDDGPVLIAYSDMGWTTWVRNVLGNGELETGIPWWLSRQNPRRRCGPTIKITCSSSMTRSTALSAMFPHCLKLTSPLDPETGDQDGLIFSRIPPREGMVSCCSMR